MKIVKKIVSVIVILGVLASCFFGTNFEVYANTVKDDNIVYLAGAEYLKKTTKSGKTYTMHIVISSINFDESSFKGKFYVTGDYTYSEDIMGDFDDNISWGSREDYQFHIYFGIDWNSGMVFDLDIDDTEGNLFGFYEGGWLTNTFTGVSSAKGAIALSLKMSGVVCEEELYDECLALSVDIYDSVDEKIEYSSEVNTRSAVPKKLNDKLKNKGYLNIQAYNFRDSRDDNVSFVIAHKKLETGKNRCVVVIRGTDGIEWEGNMKICPPDSNDNYDKYTFTNGDDTHYNFLTAANYVEEIVKQYVASPEININNENTTVVITGHSRGGAVGNLLAKILTTNDFNPIVTAYTFATPNVAPYSFIMDTYKNIYNFCKNSDLITYIPLANNYWSYWKYGETFIDSDIDDIVYCNELTDIIASDDYAPTIRDYYEKEFKHKEIDNLSISLYDFMQISLSYPMEMSNFLIKITSYITLTNWISKDFKGMYDLSTKFSMHLIKLLNHSQYIYAEKSLSHYIPFTYTDALSRCKVGGLETNSVNQFGVISLSNEPPVEETPLQNVVEISRLSQFANNIDPNGVTNAEKLGWDLEDTSTWTGVEFDENGNVLSIDLHFKDLYGTLNLADFTSLTNVDVSANYINGINVSNCTSLISLDVSDNELTELNTSGLTLLEELNCGCNDIETLNLSNNTALVTLECSDCLLTSLDVSALTDLTTLNCSFNKLSALDITNNSNLTEIYCMLNYLDLTDTNLVNSFSNINEAVYEPQYLPLNAQLDSDEINALKSFAQIGDNNSVLNFIDENGNIDLAEIQCYVQFEKVDGVYRASVIDISNEDLTGSLDLSSFDCLRELYCNDTSITSLNLSNCDNLEKLYCENSDISSLTLPTVSPTENSKLSELSCQNNKIDINIFTDDIVSNIKSKADYVLSYRHQIIDEPVSAFDADDYNILVDFANQSNNQDLLNWDLTTPGNWNEVNWIKNAETGRYMLLDCYFDCLDVSGNLDLTSCDAMETISISGSNISTISLPPMDVDDYAFYDCKKLEAVILTGGSSIGESAFKFCPVLQGVYIPDSINSISQTAFEGLQNVTVAGNSSSYAESYCSSNGIPFEPGYFICGNIVTKENNSGTYEYYYPVEDVSVSGTTAVTDQYGYFVIFGLSEGEYSYDLNYDYGYDLSLDAVIDNSPAIITTPIGMVSFDWNNDGYINAKDYSMLIRQINGENTGIDAKYYDINKDGVVNRDDWIFAQKFFLTADIEEIQDSYEGIRYAYMPSAASATFGENLHIGIEELEGEDD